MTLSSQTRTANISHTVSHISSSLKWNILDGELALCMLLALQNSNFRILFFSDNAIHVSLHASLVQLVSTGPSTNSVVRVGTATTNNHLSAPFSLVFILWRNQRQFDCSWRVENEVHVDACLFYYFHFISCRFHSSCCCATNFSCWLNVNGMRHRARAVTAEAAAAAARKRFRNIALTLFRSHLFPFNKYVLFFSSSGTLPLHLNALKIIIYCVEHTHYYYYCCCCCPSATIRIGKARN